MIFLKVYTRNTNLLSIEFGDNGTEWLAVWNLLVLLLCKPPERLAESLLLSLGSRYSPKCVFDVVLADGWRLALLILPAKFR